MNTTFGEGFAIRALRWSGCALAVAALAVAAAGVSWAQSPAGGAKAATHKAAPSKSAGSGMNTGIKVHGHWTINILSKDGKLVSHHEFENSIAYGAPILANLLGGTTVPGGLAIVLGGPVCPSAGAAYTLNWSWGTATNTCPIVVAGSAMAGSVVAYLSEWGPTPTAPQFNDILSCTGSLCSPTLTVTALTNDTALTLSGTYPAPSGAPPGASISGVAVTGYTCSLGVTIAQCQAAPPFVPTYQLPSSPGPLVEGIVLQITGTGVSPGIPVAAGQTIAVTVVISFS